MKKTYVIPICTVLLLACSVLTPLATPPPVSTPTITRTALPSATPITPTQTFTTTPTLIVNPKTDTPTVEITFTPTTAPLLLFTPSTPTAAIEMKGFVTVNISTHEFYKGKDCQPTTVKFTAQVSDVAKTAFVVLFVRFKSKHSGVTSEWTSIKMNSLGAGTFTYNLVPDEMKGMVSFQNAWVQYQIVGTNSSAREVARTGIFSERLTLLECKPAPTSSPTSTALVP